MKRACLLLETVSFTAASLEETNTTIGALIGVASTNEFRMFREMFRGVPGRNDSLARVPGPEHASVA